MGIKFDISIQFTIYGVGVYSRISKNVILMKTSFVDIMGLSNQILKIRGICAIFIKINESYFF